MGKPELVDQKNSAPLNEVGKEAYYFFALGLKDKIFINVSKIRKEVVEVRTLFLNSKCWPFKKITMPKSINH
jgi:hypothetical protein